MPSKILFCFLTLLHILFSTALYFSNLLWWCYILLSIIIGLNYYICMQKISFLNKNCVVKCIGKNSKDWFFYTKNGLSFSAELCGSKIFSFLVFLEFNCAKRKKMVLFIPIDAVNKDIWRNLRAMLIL